jgi:hypothetical protein
VAAFDDKIAPFGAPPVYPVPLPVPRPHLHLHLQRNTHNPRRLNSRRTRRRTSKNSAAQIIVSMLCCDISTLGAAHLNFIRDTLGIRDLLHSQFGLIQFGGVLVVVWLAPTRQFGSVYYFVSIRCPCTSVDSAQSIPWLVNKGQHNALLDFTVVVLLELPA